LDLDIGQLEYALILRKSQKAGKRQNSQDAPITGEAYPAK